MSGAHPLLWAAGGAGAIWAVSRWRKSQERARTWGDDHDEEDVIVVREPSDERRVRRLTRRYDGTFAVHGRGLPVPYLRALAARESGLRADDPKGLINVVRVVREDFNERHGTSYGPEALTDPVVNVTIATDTLRRIITTYAKKHPDIANLQEDWNNRHFVELLTFGWNAGWSESAGVGKVISFLEDQGRTDITLSDVVKAAHDAGASHWLWAHPKKVSWTRSVADLYFEQPDRQRSTPVVASPVSQPSQVEG